MGTGIFVRHLEIPMLKGTGFSVGYLEIPTLKGTGFSVGHCEIPILYSPYISLYICVCVSVRVLIHNCRYHMSLGLDAI